MEKFRQDAFTVYLYYRGFIPTYLLTYLDLPTYQTNNSEIRNKLGRFCETISENNFMNSLGEFITAQLSFKNIYILYIYDFNKR